MCDTAKKQRCEKGERKEKGKKTCGGRGGVMRTEQLFVRWSGEERKNEDLECESSEDLKGKRENSKRIERRKREK